MSVSEAVGLIDSLIDVISRYRALLKLYILKKHLF